MTKPVTHAPRIVIAASGTGGHLFPAAFIIRALQELVPASELTFIGSGRDLEERIIGPTKVTRQSLDIVGVKNRGILGALQFLRKLPNAWRQTKAIFKRAKPELVIGVGGYVTVLPVIMARLSGIPTWIHEAERKPGLANALLCYFASKVSVAFDDAKIPTPRKRVLSGQPLRPEMVSFASGDPVEKPRHVLVMGGSQGARPIDEMCCAIAPWLAMQGIEVRHQARRESVPMLEAAYRNAGVRAQCVEFIEDIAEAYRWAHVIVARAGAGTVMEIGVANVPTIFIPYRHAQGNHQLINAQFLESKRKALIVEEGAGATEKLKSALQELLDPVRNRHMRSEPVLDRSRTAAHTIAKESLALISARMRV